MSRIFERVRNEPQERLSAYAWFYPGEQLNQLWHKRPNLKFMHFAVGYH